MSTQDEDDFSIPRTLNVAEFSQGREKEIKFFEEVLSSRGKSLRVFQRLPSCLRRRTMSHNPHRLPRRLRATAFKEQEKSNSNISKKCTKETKRRQLRKPRFLQTKSWTQRKIHWLPTHIWHAKRMHMKDLWGYRLAWTTSDKGLKASTRAACRTCTIHDISYYNPIQLLGNRQKINTLINLFLAPDQKSRILTLPESIGSNEGTIVLYVPDKYPYSVIGPCDYLWRTRVLPLHDNDENILWLWLHPSIFEYMLFLINTKINDPIYELTSVVVTSLYRQFSRFEICGPRANQILKKVIKFDMEKEQSEEKITAKESDLNIENIEYKPKKRLKFTEDITTQNIFGSESVWNILSSLRSSASTSPRIIIGLNVLPPPVSSLRQPFANHGVLSSDLSQASINLDTNQQSILNEINKEWPLSASNSHLWDEITRMNSNQQAEKYLVPHTSQSTIISSNSNNTNSKNTIPILLIQHPSSILQGSGSGWDIILPTNWSRPFWISLIHSGARAIGIADRRRILLEQGKDSFPHDWPDSQSGKMFEEYQELVLSTNYYRKPPSKRPSFRLLACHYPFRPPWSLIVNGMLNESDKTSKLTREQEKISAQKAQKTKVDNLELSIFSSNLSSDIHLPFFILRDFQYFSKIKSEEIRPDDSLIRITLNLLNGTASYCSMICTPNDTDKKNWIRKTWQQLKQPSKTKSLRNIIGYVTDSVQSLNSGKGCAMGICITKPIVELMKEKIFFLLVRSPNSPIYYPSKFTIKV